MTISETLAEFLMSTRADDLPERTVDLAAMIIASTVASAALGRNIESARIIRGLGRSLRDRELADGRMEAVFDSDDVEQQVRLVQESGAIGAAHEEALALVSRARSALEVLPAGIERDALAALAGYVTRRSQ